MHNAFHFVLRSVQSLWLLAALCFAPTVSAEDKVTYDDHLAPIFRQRCASCHNPTARKADLDVTNYLNLMQGGASGAAIEAGDAEASYLFSLVTRAAEPFMPQDADKLPDAEIELLRRWIDGGALENQGSKAVKPKAKMSLAVQLDPGQRPEVMPLPPRMVLEPQMRLEHSPMARSLAISPWAPLVAVTSQRQVLLYNTATLELVGVLPFPEGQPNVVRFSRDGRMLLAGGGRPAASGKVVVWDITTGERVVEIGNELDVVLAADISADLKHIALGGPQRIVRVYSTESGELQHEMAKHTDWVLAVEFSPDGVLLATADRNGGLSLWETHSGNEYLTLTGHTGAVTALSWRGDSNLLASASEDATVRLWEMENGTQVKTWSGNAALLALKFTRDGRLVTCGRDQITRLWNQDGAQLVQTPPIGDVAVSASFCDESSRAIAASWAGPVQVYKAEDASVLGQLATNPPSLEERLASAEQQLQTTVSANTPLVEALRKAEADLAATQTAATAAVAESNAKQLEIEKLQAEVNQVNAERAAKDAERTATSTKIVEVQAAHALVAESLRHATEALGKLPNDAKLVEVQGQLTGLLQSMESQGTELQAKVTELTAAITAADAKLQEANTRLETAGKDAAAAAEQAKALETQSQQLATALASAQQAAQQSQAQLAQGQQAVARWKDEIAFRDQIAVLQQELEAARKLAAEQQAEVEKANAELSAVQSTVSAAAAKLDEAARNIDAVVAKIQQARTPK